MSSLRLALKQSLEAAGKAPKRKTIISEYEADFLSDRQKLKRQKLKLENGSGDEVSPSVSTAPVAVVAAAASPAGVLRKKKKRRSKQMLAAASPDEVQLPRKPGRPRKHFPAPMGGEQQPVVKRKPGRPRKIRPVIDNDVNQSMQQPMKVLSHDRGDDVSIAEHDHISSDEDDGASRSSRSSEHEMSDLDDENEESDISIENKEANSHDLAARFLQAKWKEKRRLQEAKVAAIRRQLSITSKIDDPKDSAPSEKLPAITSSSLPVHTSESDPLALKKEKRRLKKMKLAAKQKLLKKMHQLSSSSKDTIDESSPLATEDEKQHLSSNSDRIAGSLVKKKRNKRRPRTVPPPTDDVLMRYRRMSIEQKRDYISVGHRVKVRFDTSDGSKYMKKKERALYLKWYGGCVAKIYPGALRIRIAYDDGTQETADFPDKEIVVDEDQNGQHHVSDDEEEFVDDTEKMPSASGITEACTPIDDNSTNDDNKSDTEMRMSSVPPEYSTPLSTYESRTLPSTHNTNTSLSRTSMSEIGAESYSSFSVGFNNESKVETASINDSRIPIKRQSDEVNNTVKKGISSLLQLNNQSDEIGTRSIGVENQLSVESTNIPYTPATLKSSSSGLSLSHGNLGSSNTKDTYAINDLLLGSAYNTHQTISTINSLSIKIPSGKKSQPVISPRARSVSPVPKKKKRDLLPNAKSPTSSNADDVQVRSGRAAARAANERIMARQEKVIQETPLKGRRKGKRLKHSHNHQGDSDNDGTEGEGVWVQCDKCQKWRLLPSFVDSSALPDKWFCTMNVYDNFNSCDVPEQNTSTLVDTSMERVAKKKPCDADVSPTVNNASDNFMRKPKRRSNQINDSGEKKIKQPGEKETKKSQQDEQEWVQCESCQKWRKLPANGSVKADSLPDVWYCSMNTWNPKEASCVADEENYNEKTYTTIMGIGASTNANAAPSSKLSYRNLIFGTGRKSNRPYADRAKTEDSLFAISNDNGGYSMLYSNCNAYFTKKSETKHVKGGRLFYILRKTEFWQDLRKTNE